KMILVISSSLLLITSKKEARLSFKTGGIISRMMVDEGQNVRSGQLLATLDLTEINASVMQAQQNADKLQRDYERLNNLYKENAATLEQVQNISTALEVANQSLTAAKFNQQYSSIYATENGTVIKKLANEGELAAPGSTIFIINSTENNDWVIRIGVADYDWTRINDGDAAVITLDAYPAETFKGKVSEIAEAADPYSGTFQVELKVNPGARKFANGLIAKIELTPVLGQELSMIPIEALVECSGNKGFVYKLNDDKKTVTKMPVTVAFYQKDQVAISGIDPVVKEVITGGSAYLTEHSVISVAAD
ncbi:MAG TPA: efflux RND transporter periplasmic adaptor subunit, partial [Chitinophagales bacterium]|nr:efflux RND transporter periplasmic adaptor subunit [Chitinophagales bacterium]